MGGVLNNQLVICGGITTSSWSSATNNCQRLSNSGQWSLFGGGLKIARWGGAAATVTIQGEDFLWITGGGDSSGNWLKSTELVSSSGSVTSGTNLPEKRGGHCMVVINNHVMVIGGSSSSDVGREVLIFARANFSHEERPSLIKKRRYQLSCLLHHGESCSWWKDRGHCGRWKWRWSRYCRDP